jgi:hypothetical protein
MIVSELRERLKGVPQDYEVQPGMAKREGIFIDNEKHRVVYGSNTISHIISVKFNAKTFEETKEKRESDDGIVRGSALKTIWRWLKAHTLDQDIFTTKGR